MSHPEPPAGPHDPHQPPPEPPTEAVPTAPIPPVSGAPQPPPAGQQPWAPPTAPQPPVSGPPYPPVSGAAPYPPVSGAAPYPPHGPYPPVAHPPQPPYPQGPGGYPPGAGYPPAGLPPEKRSNRTLLIVIAVVVAVLALLCCGGGIAAVIVGANTDDPVESLPTPAVTSGVGDTPGSRPSSPAAPTRGSAAPTDGETMNMPAGDTLVISDDDGTIHITVTRFSTRKTACEQFGLDPDEGMYLIADVTVKVTEGSGSVNPLFFRWMAADGTESNAVAGAFSGCGKTLPPGNLSTGSERTGTVVFDVADTNGALEYQHRFETAGSWRP
ncbi:DUF4352 domain-containing protein [Micromonospora sp. URMC 103]|uniref:DUF4352 domain-containing protein n=1 Tax=Micromonospora sp. URMC 103 TaxID=3423406 RepID=UPI003F1A0D1B